MPERCYSLLLGARHTVARGKKFSRRDDATIRALTFRHFPDGFTVLNADGGWYDPAQRRFIAEESRQILVCTKSSAAVRRWCAALGRALQQKELLVVEMGPAKTFRMAPRTKR